MRRADFVRISRSGKMEIWFGTLQRNKFTASALTVEPQWYVTREC